MFSWNISQGPRLAVDEQKSTEQTCIPLATQFLEIPAENIYHQQHTNARRSMYYEYCWCTIWCCTSDNELNDSDIDQDLVK